MEDEVDKEPEQYLGRAWYERRGEGNREDYRNGFRIRHLLAVLGDLVVRTLRTQRKFVSRILEAYRRRMRTVDQLIMACFVLRMSIRKVSTALVSLLRERVSATTMSEVTKALDGEVRRYHERKLSDGYRFLFLDGVVL